MDKEVTVTLKTQEWDIVVNALAGRPFAEVAKLIDNVARQVSEQINNQPNVQPGDADKA